MKDYDYYHGEIAPFLPPLLLGGPDLGLSRERYERTLDNVWMDTSMVMDPVVLQIALNEIGPGRLLFGTDFPVAAMRGRRVRVHDHWVDVVAPGYPASAYRVTGSECRM